MLSLRQILIALVVLPLAACSSKKGDTCGSGTTLQNGMCVPSSPVTCGSGTTLQNGMCVGSPPTTCGPGTTMQNGSCVVDLTAPDPVTGLGATLSGSTVTVSWTASATANATYLVARLVAGAYDAPAALTSYSVGDTLPGGATVVAVGAATTATDALTTPGRYAYMVWPVSSNGVYGFPREAAVMSLPAQTGSITIDVAGATATVTTQPANITLAAANVAYNNTGGVLSFDLTATQNTGGELINLKAVIGTPSVGTVSNPSGTTDAGDPFVQLAIGGTLPATDLTQTISITGVASTDTVTVPITLVEASLGLLGPDLVDLDGGGDTSLQLPGLQGEGMSSSIVTGGTFGVAGRYFYGVTRWNTGVFRIDLATGDVTAISAYPYFIQAEGMCLAVGDDGYGYAAFGLGHHRHGPVSALAFAKIDLATMSVVAVSPRLTPAAPAPAIAHGCALHGTTLALGFGNTVYFADTSTMTFTDANPGTAGVIDPVTTTTVPPVQRLVFSPDGATVYVSKQAGSSPSATSFVIDAIDVASFTATAYHTAGGAIRDLTIDAAGTLWWGEDPTGGLFSFDGTTETQVPSFTGNVRAIGPMAATTIVVSTSINVMTVNTTDGTTTRTGTMTDTRLGHSFAAYPTP